MSEQQPTHGEGHDRLHLHIPDDDDVEPGDPEREPIFRDRHGRIVQDLLDDDECDEEEED